MNKYFDHTLLKADASKEEIANLIKEAIAYDFMSVCVNPTWVSFAAEKLKDSDVKVCTVIGFPLGATPSAVKAFEANLAEQNGADEVDMVINIGQLKANDQAAVKADIEAVVKAVSAKIIVKVIIETALLTDEEKIIASKLAQEAGADFVKTSTGFSTGGATAADVKLMRQTVGPVMGVKASGGIRKLADVNTLIAAGATRIGASSGVEIMTNTTSEASSDY